MDDRLRSIISATRFPSRYALYSFPYTFNKYINTILKDFLVHLLRKSQSPLLLCDQKSAARCLAAKKECANLIEIFVLGEHEGCIPFSQLLEKDALSYRKIN